MHEVRSILGALQYYSCFIPNFSQNSSDPFDILSNKSFYWHADLGKQLRFLLNYFQSDAVLKPFSSKLHSTIITDASLSGIGVILGQIVCHADSVKRNKITHKHIVRLLQFIGMLKDYTNMCLAQNSQL